MFSILLVLFIIFVSACGFVARSAYSVGNKAVHLAAKVGDPRDAVARINGSYHQKHQDVKAVAADAVVTVHHLPQRVPAVTRSLADSVRGRCVEATRRASAEYHYRVNKRRAS